MFNSPARGFGDQAGCASSSPRYICRSFRTKPRRGTRFSHAGTDARSAKLFSHRQQVAMTSAGSETIFAPATAPGRAALALVRISGAAAADVCRRLTGRPPPAPRRAGLRRMRDPQTGDAIDEGSGLVVPGAGELHRRGRARAAGTRRPGGHGGAAARRCRASRVCGRLSRASSRAGHSSTGGSI